MAYLGPGAVPPAGLDDIELQVPCRLGNLDLTGFLAVRALPDESILAVEPLIGGAARLVLGRPAAPLVGDNAQWETEWLFASGLAALTALALF